MGNRPKRHLPPEERLRAMLKSSSTIRETKHFKDQARDVFSLGGAVGLVHWIDARFEFELIQDQNTIKVAEEMNRLANLWIEQVLTPPPKPPQPSWEQRLAILNRREEQQRRHIPRVGYQPPPKALEVAERMEIAWLRMMALGRP